MLPGKRYTLEGYLRILWRRKWLIVIPVVLIGATTFAVVWRLPNRYRSTAVLEVIPQRVPSTYVQATVTSLPEERLRSLQQQILSRTRLEQIVREFNLYPVERRAGIMQDVIDRMRQDIILEIPTRRERERASEGAAFTISYVGENPQVVTRVTERLTSLVIEENLRDRERLAEGTDQFLETQLQDARKRLIEQEKRLELYRRRHAGELPSQVQSNLQFLQSAQMQVQLLAQAVAQDRDRKFMLERTLSDATLLEPIIAPAAPAQSGPDGIPADASAAQQLATARATLSALERRLQPAHPDILKVRRTISQLEAKAETEALEQPIGGDGLAPVLVMSPAEAARLARIREMKLEVESLDRQIVQKREEEKRLAEVVTEYQRRLAAVPTRESELIELTRDHETLLKLYTDLLAKKENAKMAMDMERRQIGEQFRIVDPARLPERPFSPARPQLYSLGLLAGLGLGLVIVFLLEYRDTSVRTEADVVTVLGLPVIAMVPPMVTAMERRRARTRRWMLSLGATSAAACATFVLWVILR